MFCLKSLIRKNYIKNKETFFFFLRLTSVLKRYHKRPFTNRTVKEKKKHMAIEVFNKEKILLN